MKYLDGYPELDLLSKSLSFSSPSLRVTSRIEAYSCKAIARERKLFKALEQDMLTDLSLSTSISPPEHHSSLLSSAFGPLDMKDSRKTLWLLIATLNIAFPDHDFSRLSAEEFVREESARFVLQSLSSALSHLRTSNGTSVVDGPQAMAMGLGMGMMPSSAGLDHHRHFSSSAPNLTSGHATSGGNTKNHNRQVASTSKQVSAQASKSASKKATSDTPAAAVEGTSSSTAGEATTAASAGKEAGDQHQPRKTAGEQQKKVRRSSKTAQDKPSVVHVKKPISQTALISKLRNDLDGSYEVPTHPLLRQVLDPLIDLGECEVYSYTPDLDSDPHAYQSEDEDDEEGLDEETDEEYDDLLDDGGHADGQWADEHYHHHDHESIDDIDMDLDYEDAGTSATGYFPSGYSRQNQWESQYMDGVENAPAQSAPATPTASGSAMTSASGNKRAGQSASKRRGPGAKRQARDREAQDSIFSSSTRTVGDKHGIMIPPPTGAMANADEEEDNGGLLWSTNYFFYNRKMKRILFVSVWGRKIGKQFSPSNAILTRGSGGNPLHAYRRESGFYNHQFAGPGRSIAGPARPGTIKINLNRLGSAGLDTTGVDENLDRGRAGSATVNASGGPIVSSQTKTTRSSHTRTLSAGRSGLNPSTPDPSSSTITTSAPSFAAPPPTAHAASIFKPSSPFPRGDNRHYGSISTSRLQQSWTGSQSSGDSSMPPMIRDSSSLASSTTPASPAAGTLATAGVTRPRRERSQSSNPNTPSRRSSQGTPRPHKRQASTPSVTPNTGSTPAAAAGKRRTTARNK